MNLIDEDGANVLYGHVSKANPQWKTFSTSPDVLSIFNGPHSYITASLYQEEDVPTWNYIAVHIYGTLKLIDHEEMMTSLSKLFDKYDKHYSHPMSLEGLSENTKRLAKGIVAFKIVINEVHAAFKLSQNRNEQDFNSLVKALEGSTDFNARVTAEEMKKHRNK